MAIVKNLADVPRVIVDVPFDTFNRTNAGEPNGSITPQYAGEIILDTTNNIKWKALSTTNNSWVALTGPSV